MEWIINKNSKFNNKNTLIKYFFVDVLWKYVGISHVLENSCKSKTFFGSINIAVSVLQEIRLSEKIAMDSVISKYQKSWVFWHKSGSQVPR